ncbi:MAG: hypothetical protein JWM91_3248 [Rhodospirillales bacterium]|nr:hypothetical protein [Rhodospirillales bacterium]
MNRLLMRHGGLLTILFKRKEIILVVFLSVILAGVAYLLTATPKYESVAQMIVRFGDRSIPEVARTPTTFEMTPADRHEVVAAHAAMLNSHDLAKATIESLGINALYPDIAEDPPPRWTPMDEAVKRFLSQLSVEVGTQDNIITVSFLYPDQKLAHDIVQKLIDVYIAQQTLVYQNPQSGFMSAEMKEAGSRLATAQASLEQFKDKWHIADYDQEVSDLLKQRGDVDTNLRTAQANLLVAQNRQDVIGSLIKQVPANQPEPAGGEKYRSVDDAESRLADLRAKQSQMLATYSPNSSAMASLNAAIRTAEADAGSRRSEVNSRSASNPNVVYQNLQTDLLRNSADAKANAEPVRVLSEQLQTIDQRLSDLQQNRGALTDLVREQQIAESTYRSLSTQSEDARVKDSLNRQRISPATMISQPTLPYKTARPRKLITVIGCLFGGAILAIGAALMLEWRDDHFTTAEQVAYMLDVPVLATIGERPQPPSVGGLGLLTYGENQ